VEGEGGVDVGVEPGVGVGVEVEVEMEIVFGGYLEGRSRLGPDINSFGYGLLFLMYEYSLETWLIRT
jgi:hypothetical protein